MQERQVWWNGKLIPESEARVSIYDSALMFGNTIFEMTRSFNKRHFKLREHLERLFNGIKILEIPVKYSIEDMLDAIKIVTEENEKLFESDDEHRLMINVCPGLLSIYDGNIKGIESGPNVIIANFPLRWTVASMGPLFDEGINLVITSQRTIPAQFLDPKIKNRSRLHYYKANLEASKMEGKNNFAVLLDQDGFITEGTGDNIVIVKGNQIISPEPRNILRGISLGFLKELYGGIFIEKNIEPYDVYTADECFITATPFCMLPVTSLNGIPIGTGKRGPMFDSLLKMWSVRVNVDIEAQIKSWYKPTNFGISPYGIKK